SAVPYSRTLSFYKEQRQRRKMNQSHRAPSEQLTIRTTVSSKVVPPSPPFTTYQTPRRSSLLSPHPTILPGRPVFPRSKPCPNLHRLAIKIRMLSSEEGKRILSLGPRLAMEIMQTGRDILRVTQELEDMVGGEEEGDLD
ncbi:hypothetical protein CPB83DRAFT_743050, partial [Crepidotus variabilis]